MPTHNPRINVTIDLNTAAILTSLAEQENVSLSHLAKELILEALELREDIILCALSESRDIPSAERVAYKDAWK